MSRNQAYTVTAMIVWTTFVGLFCGTGQAASPLVSVERHAEHKDNLHQFINGSRHCTSVAAFVRALSEFGQEDDVQAILTRPVSRLDGSANFRPQGNIFQVLDYQGALPPAPSSSQSRSSGRASDGQQAFQAAWNQAIGVLRSGGRLAGSALTLLHQHLAQWRNQAASPPAEPASPVYYAWKAGRLKDQYFRDLETVLRQLEDPDQQAALTEYFQTDGFSFPGGRVGDMVAHVLENRLTTRPGSPAHTLLAELGRALESFVTTEHETRLAQVNEARREAQEVERRQIEQRLLEQQYRQRETERIVRLYYLQHYYTHSYGRSYSVPRTQTYTRTYSVAR